MLLWAQQARTLAPEFTMRMISWALRCLVFALGCQLLGNHRVNKAAPLVTWQMDLSVGFDGHRCLVKGLAAVEAKPGAVVSMPLNVEVIGAGPVG